MLASSRTTPPLTYPYNCCWSILVEVGDLQPRYERVCLTPSFVGWLCSMFLVPDFELCNTAFGSASKGPYTYEDNPV